MGSCRHVVVGLALRAALVAGTAGLGAGPAAATLRFEGLGVLDDALFVYESRAFDVSHDGSLVVGESRVAGQMQAFRWTAETGIVALGGTDDFGSTSAHAVSADGSVVVGEALSTASGREPFRWTAESGAIGLGNLTGDRRDDAAARDVSADGSVVVGWAEWPRGSSRREVFRWTDDGGMELVRNEADTGFYGVTRISDDGASLLTARWLWSEADGFEDVGPDARAPSADGAVLAGNDPSGIAYRWELGGERILLGDLPGGIEQSRAIDVSADGSVVLGMSVSGTRIYDPPGCGLIVPCGQVLPFEEPFLWDAAHGMRPLRALLASLGLDLAGWSDLEATALSGDGRTVVGFGTNARGRTEGWIATIPEPGVACLVAMGLAALGSGRRQPLATNPCRSFDRAQGARCAASSARSREASASASGDSASSGRRSSGSASRS